MRRAEEHRASKTWITQAARIDLEWYPADEIAEAERQAIRRERPVHNIQHNGGRLKVEVTAEVEFSPPSPEQLAMMLALVVAAGMAAVWAFDSVANWSVKRRAERAGQQVDLPPARNLFTQDPPHWSATLLQGLMAFATAATADPEGRRETVIDLNALTLSRTPRTGAGGRPVLLFRAVTDRARLVIPVRWSAHHTEPSSTASKAPGSAARTHPPQPSPPL